MGLSLLTDECTPHGRREQVPLNYVNSGAHWVSRPLAPFDRPITGILTTASFARLPAAKKISQNLNSDCGPKRLPESAR